MTLRDLFNDPPRDFWVKVAPLTNQDVEAAWNFWKKNRRVLMLMVDEIALTPDDPDIVPLLSSSNPVYRMMGELYLDGSPKERQKSRKHVAKATRLLKKADKA